MIKYSYSKLIGMYTCFNGEIALYVFVPPLEVESAALYTIQMVAVLGGQCYLQLSLRDSVTWSLSS